jgi:uncharacterized protein YjbJ (UPF0337 family)
MIKLTNNQIAGIQFSGLQFSGIQFAGIQSRVSLRRAALLRQAVMAWVAGLAITTFSLLTPLPAMASAQQLGTGSNGVLAMPTLAAMSTVASLSGKAKAAAKDTEGKVESAYGDLTGDKGRQIKGAAKQVQGSAMNAGEEVKEGAKSVAKKVGDATR